MSRSRLRGVLGAVVVAALTMGGTTAASVPTPAPADELLGKPVDPGSRLVEFALPNPGSLPTDLVAGADGSVWVSLAAEAAVLHIDRSGNVIQKVAVSSAVMSMAPDETGGVWGVAPNTNQIMHVTGDHRFIEYNLRTPGAEPAGIWDGGDQVYFTESGVGGLGILTESTGSIAELKIPGAVNPTSLSGVDDQVWITDTGKQMWAVDRAGTPITRPRFDDVLDVTLTGTDGGEPKGLFVMKRDAGSFGSWGLDYRFINRGNLVGIAQLGDTYWSADATSNTILARGRRSDSEFSVPTSNSGITALTVTEGRYLWVLETRTARLAKLDTVANARFERTAGADRYEVASLLGEEPLFYYGVAYLVSGEKFADALSAGAAAAGENAPVLLTRATVLPDVLRYQFARLKPQKVVVVGGPASVSDGVLDTIRAIVPGIDVQRVSGADRYEVSRSLVQAMPAPHGDTSVYITDGRNYPDALSSTPAAVHSGTRVLLVDGGKSSLSPESLDLVRSTTNSGQTVKIVGGELSVSAGIEAQLRASVPVERIAGPDRYAVSAAVNVDAFGPAEVHSLGGPVYPGAYLASGENFPDALAGGAIAAAADRQLLLARRDCIPVPVLDRITSNGLDTIHLLGGTNTLSDAVTTLAPCS